MMVVEERGPEGEWFHPRAEALVEPPFHGEGAREIVHGLSGSGVPGSLAGDPSNRHNPSIESSAYPRCGALPSLEGRLGRPAAARAMARTLPIPTSTRPSQE